MNDQQHAEQGADGIWRWKSNGTVPPEDVLVRWGMAQEERALHRVVRDEEISSFLAEYRRMASPAGAEQKADARAAFGPGVEVVNIITGERYRT